MKVFRFSAILKHLHMLFSSITVKVDMMKLFRWGAIQKCLKRTIFKYLGIQTILLVLKETLNGFENVIKMPKIPGDS